MDDVTLPSLNNQQSQQYLHQQQQNHKISAPIDIFNNIEQSRATSMLIENLDASPVNQSPSPNDTLGDQTPKPWNRGIKNTNKFPSLETTKILNKNSPQAKSQINIGLQAVQADSRR